MRKAWKIVAVLGVLFLSGACADNKLRLDVQRLQGELSDARSIQAEQTAKLSSVESELRKMSGRVDEIEFQQNQRLGSALTNIKSDLTNLRRRVPPPPIVPAAELEQDEDALPGLPSELGEPLNDAFGAIRDANWERALQSLDDAMGLSVDTEWFPMVLFWKGIANEGKNDSRGALEHYIAIATKFPKYKRASLALLRQASVLVRIGDKKGARATLNKLIADYPKSSEASKARDKLKDIGR